MNGSQKQIEWANEIKASKNFSQFVGKGRSEQANRVIAKAISFVDGIDSAKFWIDHRNYTEMQILNGLMRGGIQVKGFDYDHRATMTADGTITIAWEEIVSDGKGGHKETRQQVI